MLHKVGFFARVSRAAAAGAAAVALAAFAAPAIADMVGAVPPPDAKGAVVLFSGKAEEVAANWYKKGSTDDAAWKIEDGGMATAGGDIMSKQKFTDFYLHVEFRVPYMPEAKGQGRGNSGVFLQGRYEIQVLDSYGLADLGTGDCGSVYGKSAPLINACKKPLEWQSFDIFFRAPRFDEAGEMTEKARVTVLQNGVPVQNNVIIPDVTWGENFGPLSTPGPIVLQDHGTAVRFRNVWVLPLPQQGANHY